MEDRAIHRIRQVFDAATELPAEEREAFIARACAGDEALLKSIRALLRVDAEAAPAVDVGFPLRGVSLERETFLAEDLVGKRVGGYLIQGQIGAGGMGVVFEAVRDSTQGAVALKVLHGGSGSSAALRRLEREAKILGRLQHPGIAQVHDAGVLRVGGEDVPYLAMERVRGARTLLEHAQQEKLGIPERLALFAKVCDAVHHGHENGVIHRDLKPANILVDAAGQPKVIDYGIARLTSAEMVATRATSPGQLVGTIQYMSPEQCRADPADLDHRTDVYSLGVVLYELLSGAVPYRIPSMLFATRIIEEQPPVPLSAASPRCRGDIEVVTHKALAKERSQRYQSAAELGADIRRFLARQPVHARPPSVRCRVESFCRRHTSLVVSAAAIAMALSAAAAVSLHYALRAWEERDLAEARRAQAALVGAFAQIEANQVGAARLLLASIPRAQRGWEWYHALHRLDQSLDSRDIPGRGFDAVFPGGDGRRIRVAIADSQGRVELREWEATDGKIQRDTLLGSWTARGDVYHLFLDPKGERIAGIHAPGTLFLLERAPDGGVQHRAAVPSTILETHVSTAAFSPDGRLLALGMSRGLIHLVELTTSQIAATLDGHGSDVSALTFDSRGARLASTSFDESIRLWDVQASVRDGQGALTSVLQSPAGRSLCLAFRGDGLELATGFLDGAILLWDVEASERDYLERAGQSMGVAGAPLLGHRAGVGALAYDPSGHRLISGGADATMRSWERPARQPGPAALWPPMRELALLKGHQNRVQRIVASPNGEVLLTYSEQAEKRGEAKLWLGDPVEAIPTLHGHGSSVKAVAFSSDGLLLASASGDGNVIVWSAKELRPRDRLEHGDTEVASVAFHPDVRRLASGAFDGRVRIWAEAPVGSERFVLERELSRPDRGSSPVYSIASWGEGQGLRVAAGFLDGSVAVWDLGGPAGRVPLDIDLAPAADAPAAGYDHQPVAILEGRAPGVLTGIVHARPTAGARGTATLALLDASTGKELWMSPVLEGLVTEIAVVRLPAGTTLVAAALTGGAIPVWQVEPTNPPAFQQLTTCSGHAGEVYSLAFHPDGTRLASGSTDRSVRIWEVRSGASLLSLLGHQGIVGGLAFSPDGRTLASSSHGYEGTDNVVKLWEAPASPSPGRTLTEKP